MDYLFLKGPVSVSEGLPNLPLISGLNHFNCQILTFWLAVTWKCRIPGDRPVTKVWLLIQSPSDEMPSIIQINMSCTAPVHCLRVRVSNWLGSPGLWRGNWWHPLGNGGKEQKGCPQFLAKPLWVRPENHTDRGNDQVRFIASFEAEIQGFGGPLVRLLLPL